jgi:hypothetical protein
MVTFYLAGVFLIGAFLGGLLGGVLFAVYNSNPETAVLCKRRLKSVPVGRAKRRSKIVPP